MMKSQKLRVTTGRRGMIGRVAVVISRPSDPPMVRCTGEIWRARLEGGGSVPPGTAAEVVAFEGLIPVLPLGHPSRRRPESNRPSEPLPWTGATGRITLSATG